MALEHKLQVKLAPKLMLTPSMQLTIKLLPMATLELSEMLTQEIVENPLLEEAPPEELLSGDDVVHLDQVDAQEGPAPHRDDTWDDGDYEYFFGEYFDAGYRSHVPQEIKERPPIDNTLSTANSLTEHLMWQLALQTDEELMREIGVAIIGNLDENGYLVASVDDLVAMGAWSVAEVERAIHHVQRFDPIGVAARNLQECLILQIQHRGLAGTPTETIVAHHLCQLQHRQVPEIARALGLSIDGVKKHINLITQLDPRPGSRYNPLPSHYVIPDVYVVKDDDRYVVVSNDDGLPRVRISPVYRRLVDKGLDTSDETRAYVREKLRAALELLRCLNHRQKTIHRVATSIVQLQQEFLDQGIEYLQPLVLQDVVNRIGVHESTVSRVVRNKYMHTPQGVFEMKYFFSQRVQRCPR